MIGGNIVGLTRANNSLSSISRIPPPIVATKIRISRVYSFLRRKYPEAIKVIKKTTVAPPSEVTSLIPTKSHSGPIGFHGCWGFLKERRICKSILSAYPLVTIPARIRNPTIPSTKAKNARRTFMSMPEKYFFSIFKFILYTISLNKNINNLTNEVQQIKIDILAFPFEITDEVIKDSLNLLQRETNIFTMLVLVGQIQKQIGILQKQSTSISKSPKKLLLHLEASITLLQGSLRNLQYAMSCRDILNSNKSYAQNSYMVDDFLDDFNYSDVQAASYNWSITNSAALLNYNTIDEKHIIPQLNNLFQN